MAYTIAVPIQGQNISASLFGAAVRSAINDLDSRVSQVESIAVARVTKSTYTSDSAAFTTETVWQIISGSLVQGWTYQVSMSANMSSTTVATPSLEQSVLRIRQDTTTAGTQMALAQVYIPGVSAAGFSTFARGEYTAAATASKSFNFTGNRNAGGGNHQFRASGGAPTYGFIDLVMVP